MLARTPRGDGHPVLLLPGFMADEGTLIVLKLFLENRGYEVQTWGFGRNVGFSSRHASALEQKIRYMHYKSGRKVSLVGLEPGRHVRHVRCPRSHGVRSLGDHARQSGDVRPGRAASRRRSSRRSIASSRTRWGRRRT